MSLAHDQRGYVTLWILGLCVCALFIGGISIDLWRVYSERRALAGIVDAAAIAGASGIDEEAFRKDGTVALDPQRAQELAWANLRAQVDDRSLEQASVDANRERVQVRAMGRVQVTLLKVLMQGAAPLRIEVTGSAEPRSST